MGYLLQELLVAAVLVVSPCHGWTLSSSSTGTLTKNVVYDGPEWSSIQQILNIPKDNTAAADKTFGRMTVVVGTRQDTGDRIVGVVAAGTADNTQDTIAIQEDSNLRIYAHSAAKIGTATNDQNAMNTLIAALTGVHCTAPRVENVGGAVNDGMVSGKVVILGGSDYACFAAEGLAALGSQVSLVSTNHNKIKLQNPNVQVLAPVQGDDEIGFASFIGNFDSLLDTAEDERPSRIPYGEDDNGSMMIGTTLRLLQQRHNCERYISSMTQAQRIIQKEGVLFGPNKVKSHFQDVCQQPNQRFTSIVPPANFGRTVELLLERGIVYQNDKDFLTDTKDNNIVRGWSLNAFMETSMWPSDSSGGGTRNVRFGFPVVEEEDDLEVAPSGEFTMIAEPPSVAERIAQKDESEEERQNPFVQRIVGEQEMYEIIVRNQRDCVLFLSATFCRTCKTLNPRFTTLARTTMERSGISNVKENQDGILFAKADTGGKVGKDLSRLLKVDAVPAFVCFRGGRRFGPTLSISRIPSAKLDAAIELLESGADWDGSVIGKADMKQ